MSATLVSVATMAVAAAPALGQAPVVSSFSPTAGTISTVVTISGSGFTGASVVSFGGDHAAFTVNSSSQITATVPSSAATGPISVKTSGGTGSSSSSFTVNPGISLSTATGPPTTALSISGAGLGAFEGVDVYFDSTEETVVSTNATGNFSAGVQVPSSVRRGRTR